MRVVTDSQEKSGKFVGRNSQAANMHRQASAENIIETL